MFEKVSRSLKYDSKFFFDHRHNIYMDTTVDHFTPLTLRVRGNNMAYLLDMCESPRMRKGSVKFLEEEKYSATNRRAKRATL